MPNWCENWGNISHKNKSKTDALFNAIEQGKLLEFCSPPPKEVQDDLDRSVKHTDLMMRDKEEYPLTSEEKAWLDDYNATKTVNAMIEPLWYEWRYANWGVKWEVEVHACDYETDDHECGIGIGFDSAWGPPNEAFRQLASMGYEFDMYFFEGGMDFCGYMSGKDGEFTYESRQDAVKLIRGPEKDQPSWMSDEFEHLADDIYDDDEPIALPTR